LHLDVVFVGVAALVLLRIDVRVGHYFPAQHLLHDTREVGRIPYLLQLDLIES